MFIFLAYYFSKFQMCSAHMSLGNQADPHYRAVCRAFVAEWLELTTFLREVSKGTKVR